MYKEIFLGLGILAILGTIFYLIKKPWPVWVETKFYEWRPIKTYRSGIIEWRVCREEKDINDPSERIRFEPVYISGGVEYQRNCPDSRRLNDPWIFTSRPLPPELPKEEQ